MDKNYKTLKVACYSANITMAAVGSIPPMLFLTFHNSYGISYSLLGTLVLINFFTQLIIDLIFSFFSHKFNIQKTVRIMPILTVLGLCIFALSPIIFKEMVYLGLVIGTVIFSLSAGLAEVLISPIIAEIPAKNPEREMSKLHSVYAWGVVGVVVFSTLFLLVFKQKSWQILVFILMIIPVISFVLFMCSKLPVMPTPERVSGAVAFLKNKWLWACFFCIFLGGAAECTMAQWCSSYIEGALSIPKVWGDIFGVALFAVMLGIGRTLYSKIGKNITRVLFLGAIGASACYVIAAFSPIKVLGLLACAFTGFCVSMMWPGSLIVASDKFPTGGVFIYAIMAAGGDMGASFGPQIVGLITDFCIENKSMISIAEKLNILPEQFSMRFALVTVSIFPILAIFLYYSVMKSFKKQK
jgi:MFS family permease